MHTPGPWCRGQDGNLRVYGPDGQGEHSGLIATVHREACIDLIAAAPDLLATLKRAREELRLIEMKDCGAVYDTTLRVAMDIFILKAET